MIICNHKHTTVYHFTRSHMSFVLRRYCAPWIAVHVGTLLFCADPHALMLNEREREREGFHFAWVLGLAR